MTLVALSSAPALISSARACCSIWRRTSGGSLRRASTVTAGFFFRAGMTLVRSFVQNSSTSDAISKSSLIERASFLHVEGLHVDGQRRRLDRRGRVALDDVGEAVGRLFDEHLHVRGREILPLQLRGDLVQLVEAHRRLAGRRSARHEFPDVLFHIVERRAVLAALPDVRERLGELDDGAR